MSIIYGLENVTPEMQGCVLAIGVFDGVHWGHRTIFKQLTDIASQHGLKSAVMTFDRHPAELLFPTRAPYYISTIEQRVENIKKTGVNHVIVAEFSPQLANLSKEDFVSGILLEKLKIKHVVVGSNFRFGKNREGDIRYLESIASQAGIGVTVVPSVIIDNGPVSSTRIREMIKRGDVVSAAKLLGRRFVLRGTVVTGRQVGRTIGFPTANIHTAPRQVVPARGVYAVEVTINNTTYGGVCNIGCRPTFDAGKVSIEVHISGFEGDIYGETLDVVFCRRLRDEIAFDSPEHLANQIKADLEDVKNTY